jgi:hypothetical protein
MFSRCHFDAHILPLLLKQRNASWNSPTKRSSPLSITYNEKPYYLCLGCKKCKSFLPSDHLMKCPHAEAHFAEVKRIMDIEGGQSESGDVRALKKEIEDLKRKLKLVKEDFEAASDRETAMDEFVEKIFGKLYSDMAPEDIEDVQEAAARGTVLSLKSEEEPEEG